MSIRSTELFASKAWLINTGSQTTNLTVGSTVVFNSGSIIGSGISLDTTSGIITLQPGIWELNGSVTPDFNVTTVNNQRYWFQWRNKTSNTYIGAKGETMTSVESPSMTSKAIINVTSSTQIDLVHSDEFALGNPPTSWKFIHAIIKRLDSLGPFKVALICGSQTGYSLTSAPSNKMIWDTVYYSSSNTNVNISSDQKTFTVPVGTWEVVCTAVVTASQLYGQYSMFPSGSLTPVGSPGSIGESSSANQRSPAHFYYLFKTTGSFSFTMGIYNNNGTLTMGSAGQYLRIRKIGSP